MSRKALTSIFIINLLIFGWDLICLDIKVIFIVVGIDTLNRAVSKLTSIRDQTEWRTVLLEITTSEVKTIDCSVSILHLSSAFCVCLKSSSTLKIY